MRVSVLVAVADRWDGPVTMTFEQVPTAHIVRRCADLPDLLAAAASGLAEVAVVSSDLRGLDRTALARLAEQQVSVIGLFPPGDDDAERRLHQLGLTTILPADASAGAVEEAVHSVDDPEGESTTGPAAGSGAASLEGDVGGWGPAMIRAGYLVPGAEPAEGRQQGDNGDPADGALAGQDPAGAGPARGVIAVWGPTGAPGRTTLAVNLAAELARAGVSTLLVDADTYGGCVAQALSLLDEAPGVAAATRLADQGTLDLAALSRVAPEVMTRLRVLTGLPRADRWPELREHAFAEVLTIARQLATVVVIDCGFCVEDDEELSYDTRAPRRNAATLAALAEADTVLAVGSADPVGLQRLVRGLQELAPLVSEPPRVVVNKVRSGAVGGDAERRVGEALARFAGVADPWFVPEDRVGLDAAMLAGRALVEAAGGSGARRAIAALACDLVGLEPVTRRRRFPGARRARRA